MDPETSQLIPKADTESSLFSTELPPGAMKTEH